MDIPTPSLDYQALLIPVEPTLETVSLKEFVARIEEKGEEFLFTDGYVLGDIGCVSEEFGIDTIVPGRDSSYHSDEDIGSINITKHGFSLQSENGDKLVQFLFLEQIPAPDLATVAELAQYQAANPRHMIADNFSRQAEDFVEAGTTIGLHIREVDGEAELYHMPHFEEVELIGKFDLSTPLARIIMTGQSYNAPSNMLSISGKLPPEFFGGPDTALLFLKPETKPWKI